MDVERYVDFVYYEEIKRELKRIHIYECRCNERLKPEVEDSETKLMCWTLGVCVFAESLFPQVVLKSVNTGAHNSLFQEGLV